MMKRLSYILFMAMMMGLMVGCIKNDIPYPRIQANFLTFAVEGESQSAVIDSATRVINVTLSEDVDIYKVKVTDYSLTPGSEIVEGNLSEPIDMSKPVTVMLKLFQEYWWVIKATQPIERYINVAGQMGTSTIDIPARRIIVTMPESADLTKARITSIKLGPTGSTMTPDLNGATVNLTSPIQVTVTAYGREEIWTIYTQTTESTVSLERVDAWTRVAWAYAQGQEGKNNGFEYRLGSSDTWTRVPAEWITTSGGSFSARIIHLQPQTEYAVRAYSDEEYTPESVITTGAEVQVPNSDFENWWLDGKIWCPWAQDGEPYWGTGNKGAATLGTSNTVPTEDTPSGTGQAAKLETRFVGVGSLGKLAAGNIFTGAYLRTEGTNGVLSMGRPYTQCPTKLRGWFKYNMCDISHTNSEMADLKGRPDTCIVWIALIDSEEPFEVRTKPSDRHLFDPNGPEVVAYGHIQYGHSVEQYTQFEVEFEYKSTRRVPSYIIMTASASKYGDYFTGGNGSVMYVDDFKLEYDY